MNRAKALVHLLVAMSLSVGAFFACKASIDWVVAHPNYLDGGPEPAYERHLWVSLALLASFSVALWVVRQGTPAMVKKLNRRDAYALFVYARVALVVALELANVPPYADLHTHVTTNLGSQWSIVRYYPPVMVLWGYVNGVEQQAVFEALGVGLSVADHQIVGFFTRMNKLPLELLVVRTLESLFGGLTLGGGRQAETAGVTPALAGTWQGNGNELDVEETLGKRGVLLATFQPFTPLVAYAWCTFDLLAFLFTVVAALAAKESDFVGAGISLGLGFLTKGYPVAALGGLLAWLLVRRRLREGVKLAASFLVVTVALTLIYGLANPDYLERNIFDVGLGNLLFGRFWHSPLFENAWLFLSTEPRLATAVGVLLVGAGASGTCWLVFRFRRVADRGHVGQALVPLVSGVTSLYFLLYPHHPPWYSLPVMVLASLAADVATSGDRRRARWFARSQWSFVAYLGTFTAVYLFSIEYYDASPSVAYSSFLFGRGPHAFWLLVGFPALIFGHVAFLRGLAFAPKARRVETWKKKLRGRVGFQKVTKPA
ncbi:MAG: hypothetical protein Kow0069_29710 [Promethearchaeota archaeon]